MIRAILIILILPSAAAGWGATVEGGVYSYPADTFNFARDNPASGVMFTRNLTITDELAFPVDTRTGAVHIGYSLHSNANANGIWRWTITWDGVAQTACFWEAETHAIVGIGVVSNSFSGIFCTLNNTQMAPGNHTFSVSRATQSGSPASIQHEFFSYELLKYDFLEVNMTNDLLDALQTIAPLLIFLIFTIWAERSREWSVYFLAVLAGIYNVILLWDALAAYRIIMLGAVFVLGLRGYLELDEVRAVRRKENDL